MYSLLRMDIMIWAAITANAGMGNWGIAGSREIMSSLSRQLFSHNRFVFSAKYLQILMFWPKLAVCREIQTGILGFGGKSSNLCFQEVRSWGRREFGSWGRMGWVAKGTANKWGDQKKTDKSESQPCTHNICGCVTLFYKFVAIFKSTNSQIQETCVSIPWRQAHCSMSVYLSQFKGRLPAQNAPDFWTTRGYELWWVRGMS